MQVWICVYEQGMDILIALLGNPSLVSASNSLKANPERKFSDSEETSPERSKCVYIFQREYATVDPAIVDVCNFLTLSNVIKLIYINSKIKISYFLLWYARDNAC